MGGGLQQQQKKRERERESIHFLKHLFETKIQNFPSNPNIINYLSFVVWIFCNYFNFLNDTKDK
jgi:hypothetical protein